MPTLGGKLALVNANFWIIVFLLARSRSVPEWLFEYLAIPLSILIFAVALPIGIFALMPSGGPPTVSEIVFGASLLGLNAFLWGYGLAWVWYRIKPWLPREIDSEGRESAP